jgi:hypothetical protein
MTVYQVELNLNPGEPLVEVRAYRAEWVTFGRYYLTHLKPDGTELPGHVRSRAHCTVYLSREEAVAANLDAMREAVATMDRKVRDARHQLDVMAAVLADRGVTAGKAAP